MSAPAKLIVETADVDACRGLDPVRKELAAFAGLARPVLLCGDVFTVRALVPCLAVGRPIAELSCGLFPPEAAGLRELLATHRTQLAQPGLLLLLGFDELREVDRQYFQTIVRTGALDARGGTLKRRLVCHVEPGRPWRPEPPGLFLEVAAPPLAQRPDDAVGVLGRLLARAVGPAVCLDGAAAAAVTSYAWPGGLLEVIMRAERATALRTPNAAPTVSLEDLGLPTPSPRRSRRGERAVTGRSLGAIMREYEAEIVGATLARHDGNKSRAARELEISRSYLIQKCKAYGID